MSGDLIQQLGSLNLNRDLKGQKVEIPGVADAVKQLRILLECLIVHAVEADLAPRHQFQQEIKIVAESLREDIATPDLEMAIGKTVRAVEDYHHQASDAFKRQVSELRALFALMAETAAFIATGNEATVQQMALVEAKLKQAVRLQDPRQMRTFMEESLALVLAESKRVESEARAKTAALDSEVARLKGLLKSAQLAASDDPITGLPARAAAEQAIENAVNAGKEFAIALFVIDRLISINGRFGRLVGDQVLVNGALSLAERLHGATLYRWSGPSFLAVFDPSVSAMAAEANAKQAAAFRIEKDFQIHDRNALVVITCSVQFTRIPVNAQSALIAGTLDAALVRPEMGGK